MNGYIRDLFDKGVIIARYHFYQFMSGINKEIWIIIFFMKKIFPFAFRRTEIRFFSS